MAAFVILLAAAIALTLVGWLGMQRTQRELSAYEGEVLPQIAQALELAERTTRLAATAPNLAESRTPESLDANATIARGLISEIRQRSGEIDVQGPLKARLDPLIDRGDINLLRLAELTQMRQQVRQRLQTQMERLEDIGSRLHARGTPPRHGDPVLTQVWSSLVLGASVDTPATLGRLQADVEALLIAADRRDAYAGLGDVFRATLRELSIGPAGILRLRSDQINLDGRSGSLVLLTRTNADELSAQVSRHVDTLRETAQTRSELVSRAIASGKTGLLLLTLVCGAIALGATAYVHRLVGGVERITAVMSRLARGDTSVATPATARRDELGALARTFEVFRDNLLAKQQLVADLREQGELRAAVHSSMNDGLAVFDRDGRLRLWNEPLERMLAVHGVQPAAGQPPRQLMAQLAGGIAWRAPGRTERQALAAGALPPFTAHAHVELYLPDNRVYDVRSRAMPDGGVVSLVTDLTERRAIEVQLQHALRLEMLGQLTGGVAHDFNNHLGTIVGTLGLLESQPALDAAGRAQLQRAARAAERASALTRRLLAFARRQPLQAEPVMVDAMVEEMVDLIDYSAGGAVQVALALQAGGASVHLDRGQLENALLNLVINSAAAMPEGGRLEIATRVDDGELELRVTDTGSGIPEALREKVFEPFFTTKADGEGSGLGLSIVYGFVKQSGGRIALASRVGEGTSVTLRFALEAGAAPPVPAAAPAPAADGPAASVLLVDDDEAFRHTVTEMLSSAGCRVHAVASAEQALHALDQGVLPQLMLSDVRLGDGMSGVQLARTVATRWPQLRVALMSGMPLETVASQADGGWPFLQKPFDAGALRHWLRGLQ
ncbi:ATP-binding protein [Rhizobacter sp. SG703]|uniref:ATP-binding protein n=1 Tax=Rhizobacter sp. SG703 TaxID=2587140 RepID=UPI00144841DA|nr:ATP-binding protein [Rhizobacter sp. SG703]NKI93730.1 signal transduction histidine kinase/CheY-like chemotaxis protein [Rhizobacter sp. SG703]